MKKSARAAATALLPFVTVLGLALPTAWSVQSALGPNCPGCWPESAPSGRTAEAGGCPRCWGGSSVRTEPSRTAPKGGCGNCWSHGATAPARWNGDYGDA